MLTLAIETSNPSALAPGHNRDRALGIGPGVAIGEDATALDHEAVGNTERHGDDLMPAIDRLCARNNIAPRGIERIAVSVGPGGFTGLRIATVTAKLLAEVTGAAVHAVPSWLSARHGCDIDLGPGPIAVCLASKRTAAWVVLTPDTDAGLDDSQTLGTVEVDAIEDAKPRALIGDRFLPETFRAWADANSAPVLSPRFSAAAVWAWADRVPAVDPLQLSPLYAREPEAVTRWREQRGG
ncbi:MAG: tRNA (adenosine(37)-N6)-threonylcarbamoyltransferase complex dimerization subunit type 1 TsaB [Planctomycetota bacterium]